MLLILDVCSIWRRKRGVKKNDRYILTPLLGQAYLLTNNNKHNNGRTKNIYGKL